MPDQETVARVARILARAGSDNPNEASAALSGAYKRMVRDGVSLHDLLMLPDEALYQDTLVKLVDVILADQDSLSPAAKREAYAEYMMLIAARFSTRSRSGAGQHDGPRTSEQERTREEEARQYEERRRQQEQAKGRSGEQQSSSQSSTAGDTYSRANGNTGKQESVFSFKLGQSAFSFSPARFWAELQPAFSRGSLLWYVFHDPARALRLMGASILWGMGFAGIVLVVAGVVHGLLGMGPLWDVKLRNAFGSLAALGTAWKARLLYLDGWFR